MTSEAGNHRDDTPDADRPPGDTAPNPWTRVLGILVLGSFAAATRTARGSRAGSVRTDRPTETAA